MPFLSLREDSFPYLINSDLPAFQQNAMNWNIGAMYNVQVLSNVIRVNKKNIQWFLLEKNSGSNVWPYLINFADMPSWNAMSCYPTQNALCEVRENDSNMLIFPSTIVDMPLDYNNLKLPKGISKTLSGLTCSSATSNRQLNIADTTYEMSLCDLVDTNLEFVYRPHEHQIYWRQVQLSTIWLVISTLLTLFFFTKVCEHMLRLLGAKDISFDHSAITLPVVCAIYLGIHHIQTQSFMLLYEEIILHYILLWYIISQSSGQLLKKTYILLCDSPVTSKTSETHDEINGISISALLCIQLALTAELQNSYDNPFLQILTMIFGVRNCLKFMNLLRKYNSESKLFKFWKLVHWVCDSFVFCSLLVCGVRISAQSEEENIVTCTAIIFIGFLTGTLLHRHSQNQVSVQ